MSAMRNQDDEELLDTVQGVFTLLAVGFVTGCFLGFFSGQIMEALAVALGV